MQVTVDIFTVGWDLLELEQAAHLVLIEEKESGESTTILLSSDSKHSLENSTSPHHDNLVAEQTPNPMDYVQPDVATSDADIHELSSGLEQVLVFNHTLCHIENSKPLIEEIPPKETQTERTSSSSSDSEYSYTETSSSSSECVSYNKN